MGADARTWHFGVLAAGGAGHLNPLIALSLALTARGHRVTLFGKPKSEAQVRQAGLHFVPLAANGSIAEMPARIRGIRGEMARLRARVGRVRAEIEMYLAQAPQAVAKAQVDVLLVDEIVLAGPTVAELLDLPWVIVSTSAPHRFGWSNTAWLTGYRVAESGLSWLQSLLLETSVLRMRGPIGQSVDRCRAAAGLGPMRTIEREYPCLAHIAHLPRCLDRPRRKIPREFCYAGPFVNRAARPYVDFPWERLDGRPLIYVTLGTTGDGRPALLRTITEACSPLDAQLVISLGNRFAGEEIETLPGNPVVVRYAPQLDLLDRVRLVITHAGLNTVMETLMAGKPMIAIPLAFDQPAVAAQLRRLGVAEILPVMRLSPARARRAIQKVLLQTSYTEAAERMQSALCGWNGAEYAAKVMENALAGYLRGQGFRRTEADATWSAATTEAPCGLHLYGASDSSASTASLNPP